MTGDGQQDRGGGNSRVRPGVTHDHGHRGHRGFAAIAADLDQHRIAAVVREHHLDLIVRTGHRITVYPPGIRQG